MQAANRGVNDLASGNNCLFAVAVIEAQALDHVLANIGAQELHVGDVVVERRLLFLAGEVLVHG